MPGGDVTHTGEPAGNRHHHADATGDHYVQLTPETFAEVVPREHFAQVTFQRCPDSACGQTTMTVLAERGASASYVFHVSDDELSAIELGAGRLLAGL